MIRLSPLIRVSSRINAIKWKLVRSFSSQVKIDYADQCDLNIVSSPFPPIRPPPYNTVPEFVMADWKSSLFSNKTAITDGTTGQTRTFSEYDSHAVNLAASLKHDLNLTEDSTIALMSPNSVEYIPICMASGLIGSKLVPINPLYSVDELETILKQSRASVLIAHESVLPTALKAARRVTAITTVVTIPLVENEGNEHGPEGTTSLCSLNKDHSSPVRDAPPRVRKTVDSHVFLLPFSSGTTGLPKGVCLTHENIVCNLLQMDEVEGMPFPFDHKLISPLPAFHIYGFLASFLYCAWRGQELLTFSGRFDLEAFCRMVEERKPQRAHLVPPIILGLAKHPMVKEFDLSSLSVLISAAAPLSGDLERDVEERLGVIVKQAWGMSELSPIGTFTSDYNVRSGSIGPLVSSTYGKIVNSETGTSLPPMETGELLVKGPQVMLGYLNSPDKTNETISKDGWLKTGDIGYHDGNGFFYVTDRAKELIKVKAFQVAPAELEALLLTNPHIKDTAVIPRPDEESGELPRAYVVLNDDPDSKKVTEKDVQDWIKERVVPYKRLNGGVVFTDEIPKSASGKILRRILRDADAQKS